MPLLAASRQPRDAHQGRRHDGHARAPIGVTVTLTYHLVHNPDWLDPDDGDWLVARSELTETWGMAYLYLLTYT
jgi:hypothetical protein